MSFRFLLAAFFALIAAPLAAQDFPALSGRVVDAADIIPANVEAELTAKLEALEAQSQRQLVVATVPDLQGYEIADYNYQLGRAWGIGDAQRNDGVVLLVAPNERRVNIATGYGVEGYLTDALSSLIIQNAILPRFKADDYPGGIVAGTDAIIAQLQLPEDQARQIAAEASQQRESQGGFPFGGLIWVGFIFFFFILPMMRGGRRRRRYRGDRDMGDTARDIILWEVGSAIVRGALSDGDDWGGGGSFGGGGGFGGGFSGGGGSFGGGGASGGW